MATTLFDLALMLTRRIAEPVEGTATGGSTTTLLDTARTEPDDYFNGGIILFRSGNNANKYAKITDFALSTGTFTFATQSLACAATNAYTAGGPRFPQDTIIMAINMALNEIKYMEVDETVVVVADQEEYTLPAGVGDVRVVQYGEAGSWKLSTSWTEENGQLFFLNPPTDGTMRIHYVKRHAELTSATSTIVAAAERMIDRIIAKAAMYSYQWAIRRAKGVDPELSELYNYWAAEENRLHAVQPFRLLPKTPLLAQV